MGLMKFMGLNYAMHGANFEFYGLHNAVYRTDHYAIHGTYEMYGNL